MKIRFLGGAGTVTGSKFLLSEGHSQILIDCGMFQGLKNLRLKNWEPLPLDAKSLDAVVLTHAHIDHSGCLPILVREGFEGPIYCTAPTRDLCEILLTDSGRIHEEDAKYANKKGFTKHKPARPLFDERDAKRVLPLFHPLFYGETITAGAFEIRLQTAGHILGAASARISGQNGTILFSGDLGRPDDLLMHPPSPPGEADWIVMESTYGDRLHLRQDPIDALTEILRKTRLKGGSLLIPSFAVGRAQNLLYGLYHIFQKKLAPPFPVFLDSPMAANVTALYCRYSQFHRLSGGECRRMCEAASFVNSVAASKKLNRRKDPMVLLASSGMLTGGRILHHLKHLAPKAANTVLFPGYQAPGTRGGSLVRGAHAVKIHGHYVPVHAEVIQLDAFSAHADQGELIQWLGSTTKSPKGVFLVHGDPSAADELRRLIQDYLGFHTTIPEYLEEVALA